MRQESAVTKTISYRVEECRFCGTEVGLGEEIPEDELVKPGFVVLAGEGEVSVSQEQAGNWDTAVKFTGEQSDVNPPTVTGHILCEECANVVHNHSPDGEKYRGPLPDELLSGTGDQNLPISELTLGIIIAVIILLVILLLL